MKKVLVIGASGFLGKALLGLASTYRVFGTYHRNWAPGLLHLDVRKRIDVEQALDLVNPDIIIYAAGLTNVDECEARCEEAQSLNQIAPMLIARSRNLRFVYISTDYVFDGTSALHRLEDATNPVNFYGRSKLAGEVDTLDAGTCNAVIRVSGLYDSSGIRDVPPGIGGMLLSDTRISSPVHIDDVVDAVRIILDTGATGVFHAGGPHALSRYEFGQIAFLHGLTGGLPIGASESMCDPGARRPQNTSLNSSKLLALGWKPRSVAEFFCSIGHKAPVECPESRVGIPFGSEVKGVLLDCVGVVLAPRTWQPHALNIDEVDDRCARVQNGRLFWSELAQNTGLDIVALQEAITSRYVPNRPIWSLLPYLASRYRLALVNNGASETFYRWVSKYGLKCTFRVLANSEEMAVRKPNANFFLQTVSKLELTTSDCVVIDDAPENVAGARRCGLHAIPTYKSKSTPVASYYFDLPAGFFHGK
jgi:S-adenosylmethionine synthetase